MSILKIASATFSSDFEKEWLSSITIFFTSTKEGFWKLVGYDEYEYKYEYDDGHRRYMFCGIYRRLDTACSTFLKS